MMTTIHETIKRTDKDVDNSAYVLKIPYTHTDDFGNEGTFYRKETVTAAQLADMEASVLARDRKPDLTEEKARIALLKAEKSKEDARFENEKVSLIQDVGNEPLVDDTV